MTGTIRRVIALATIAGSLSAAEPLASGGAACRLEPAETVFSLKDGAGEVPVLRVAGHPEWRGTATGSPSRRVAPDPGHPGVFIVRVEFKAESDGEISHLVDRLMFLPALRADGGPLSGPLDLVWSPKVKTRPECLVSHWDFKSPAVLFQQEDLFAAVVPDLSGLTRGTLTRAPLALDLDVTGKDGPWLACGVIPHDPEGHSHFVRNGKPIRLAKGEELSFTYRVIVSREPARLGYRTVARFLWEEYGRTAFRETLDLQRNYDKKDLWLFDAWRQEAWKRFADEVWREAVWNERTVGTLASLRRAGHRGRADDVWFNAWFQTLRTACGMHVYGERAGDAEAVRRAVAVLDLALALPRQEGLFPTVGRFEKGMGEKPVWYRDNKWAGFEECYHAFDMCWTGVWILKFAERVPERRDACLAMARELGDFLVAHQLASGCIPSWFDGKLAPRPEFRDFNAETAPCALFLAELFAMTRHAPYLAAARKGMDFVTREVLPRHRWFDYETFLSCSKKPFDFHDTTTAQYPQNNLATIQAAQGYLKLHELTGEKGYLDTGEQVLDYLLLTQQVWNHPLLTPRLVGGFTTQNTDAEWSDARQCYCATLLLDYYNATGKLEYLERAVAAARSTFAVAPYENWAHKGWEDKPGAMTGFHWGTGSAMASVEMMCGQLADAYIHAGRNHGVGFNACTVSNVKIDGESIAFDLAAAEPWTKEKGPLRLRVDGVDPARTYRLSANGRERGRFPGADLLKGIPLDPR